MGACNTVQIVEVLGNEEDQLFLLSSVTKRMFRRVSTHLPRWSCICIGRKLKDGCVGENCPNVHPGCL